MADYSLNIPRAVLNDQGLAEQAGWITVYGAHPLTREYCRASMEYLPLGIGLPEHGYQDAPTLPGNDAAILRAENGNIWEIQPDFRGKTAYVTATRQAHLITEPGELPPSFTLLPPATDYDIWTGKRWKTDTHAEKAAVIASAEKEKTHLTEQADRHIATLARAVKLGIATPEEKTLLTQWETYSVLLRRVETANAASVIWPAVPGTVAN
ncbi:tail fiber assembly protein [Sodalis sp. dw_96]|uniref:tail fiber assembly protein n=1 Tax=Sodalis sp. dw_96 TaxID=2719794 RepID=UPI001BD205A0|nr:tail fiber assembly protein [Sodalis sp. dw_96]